MKNFYSKRSTCRLCDESNLELVLHLKPTPIADHYVTIDQQHITQETYPLDLYLCESCGHVQLLDVIDPEILFREYSYVTSVSPGLVRHFQEHANQLIERLSLSPRDLVVEIGSNDGSFLKFFQESGIHVLGVDPALEVAKEAVASGVDTLPSYFTVEVAREILQDFGSARVICANNVFAHIDNLRAVVDGVYHLMSDDGVFVFEVSYLVDIVQKMLFDTVYHEHLCYHSIKPLCTFFNMVGMELFDVERIPTKGGSIRCWVQKVGHSKFVADSVQSLLDLEDELMLDKVHPFKHLLRRINTIKHQLLGLIGEIELKGQKLVGYGASATVTTLLYHFEMTDVLDFLVDDNPRKHNTYSPGKHIPVYSSDAIYERQTDYVVILAWPYAEVIVQRHKKFLDQGGHFILPFPEVKVL